ncbi:hypothetical protein LPJ74_004548, partial [Coemansia sp. RSA 1843]
LLCAMVLPSNCSAPAWADETGCKQLGTLHERWKHSGASFSSICCHCSRPNKQHCCGVYYLRCSCFGCHDSSKEYGWVHCSFGYIWSTVGELYIHHASSSGKHFWSTRSHNRNGYHEYVVLNWCSHWQSVPGHVQG